MPRSTKPPPQFVQCPFRIVACSNEGAPYLFKNIKESAIRGGKTVKLPVAVEVVRKGLWTFQQVDIEITRGKRVDTFSTGLADYCIDGDEFGCQVERKSLSDLFGTLGGRRGKFEAEIKRLDRDCKCAYLVIESDLPQISTYDGSMTVDELARIPEAVDAVGSAGLGVGRLSPMDDLFRSIPAPHFSPDGDDLGSFDLEFSTSVKSVTPSDSKSHGVSPATVIGTWRSWSMKYPKVHWVFASNRSMGEAVTYHLLKEYWEKNREGFWR